MRLSAAVRKRAPWLSHLPAGWRLASLEQLVDPKRPICYGVVQPGDHSADGVPLIRSGDVRDGEIAEGLRTISKAIADAYRRSRLDGGEIVVSLVGDPGQAARVPRDLAGANIARQVGLLAITDAKLAAYVECYLNSPVGRTILLTPIVGSAQQVINLADLKKTAIAIPPRSLLSKTVELAGFLNTESANLKKLEQSKQALKRGLMQQLLTGQKRFPEFVKSEGRHPGQFGTVPQDWHVVHIGDIAHEVKTRGEANGAVVYSCTKHAGLVPSLEYFGKQVFSRNLDGYKRLQAGDFAYATNHIEEGSIGLLREGLPPGLVSPMYTVFRPTDRVNPEFLFALLKTESYRRVFETRMSASVDRRGSLRWNEFSRIRIGLPSTEEQDRIAETLLLADQEIDQLARQRELIFAYKRGLLSKLLSGEIPVPA